MLYWNCDGVRPEFPRYVLGEPVKEAARVGAELAKPVPANVLDLPVIFERVKDDRGDNVVARWATAIQFTKCS